MRSLAQQLKQRYPDSYASDWSLLTTPLAQRSVGDVRPALLVLLGAVGFVLLIACANVANLLLARAAARSKEIAVRTALGASRDRLVRQLLTESLLLALAGGVLGLLLAYWGVRCRRGAQSGRAAARGRDRHRRAGDGLHALRLGRHRPPVRPRPGDARVARPTCTGCSRRAGGAAQASGGGQGLRRTLVVAEVALALTLLTGAGLLVKSFARLQGVDPGFDPEHLLTFNLSLPATRYPADSQQTAFFDQVLPAIAAVPGVRAAGATSVMPFSGSWSTASFEIEGYQPPPKTQGPWGDVRIVTPGFFETLRVPLRKGRFLGEEDRAGGRRVAVIDEEFVRRYWPQPGSAGEAVHVRPAGRRHRHDREGVDRGRRGRGTHQARRARRRGPAAALHALPPAAIADS